MKVIYLGGAVGKISGFVQALLDIEGIALLLEFKEQNGLIVRDSSSNELDFTIDNVLGNLPEYNANKLSLASEGAFALDGETIIEKTSSALGRKGWSYMFRFAPQIQFENVNALLFQYTAANNSGIWFYLTSGLLQVRHEDALAAIKFTRTSNELSLFVPYYLFVTFDATNAQVTVKWSHLDGQLIEPSYSIRQTSTESDYAHTELGLMSNNSSTQDTPAIIDTISAWETVLTDSDMSNIIAAGINPSPVINISGAWSENEQGTTPTGSILATFSPTLATTGDVILSWRDAIATNDRYEIRLTSAGKIQLYIVDDTTGAALLAETATGIVTTSDNLEIVHARNTIDVRVNNARVLQSTANDLYKAQTGVKFIADGDTNDGGISDLKVWDLYNYVHTFSAFDSGFDSGFGY